MRTVELRIAASFFLIVAVLLVALSRPAHGLIYPIWSVEHARTIDVNVPIATSSHQNAVTDDEYPSTTPSLVGFDAQSDSFLTLFATPISWLQVPQHNHSQVNRPSADLDCLG